MNVYQIVPNTPDGMPSNCVHLLPDGFFIPVTDPSNTYFQTFKAEILADQAQLEDAEGNVMSPEAAKEYVRSLP